MLVVDDMLACTVIGELDGDLTLTCPGLTAADSPTSWPLRVCERSLRRAKLSDVSAVVDSDAKIYTLFQFI